MKPTDPFGRAVRDWYHDEMAGPLIQRDGATSIEHPIEELYFQEFDAGGDTGEFLESYLDGPLLDMGAGAGRHALHFQEEFDTVAIDNSQHLVGVMDERGVEAPRDIDMFSLFDAFGPDRFRSALSIGTHLGLAGSLAGVRTFLQSLAYVTTDDATAVLDSYDPTRPGTPELLGYRSDPQPGLAHRVMHFEYDGDVGETLLFRLFSIERLQETLAGTPWQLAAYTHVSDDDPDRWIAALEKA